MVYTLSRGANETFSLGNKRIYGAWGDLRYDGNQGSGPNTQYCANLGHKLDGESGLTYMRARYYEPWTGRFLSEDAARDNLNWYVYAANSPTVNKDFDGQVTYSDIMFWGEAEAMKAAVLRLGLSAIGRAEQLALTLMTKYSALGALIGAGMTRRGDQFFWMFRDAAGNLHRVRFDMVAGILKHDSSGSNAGIPHHMMKYQDLIKEMIKLFDDG
jgi:RHS repeat-associated protein